MNITSKVYNYCMLLVDLIIPTITDMQIVKVAGYSIVVPKNLVTWHHSFFGIIERSAHRRSMGG